jgi:hypothetical protein
MDGVSGKDRMARECLLLLAHYGKELSSTTL